MKTTTIAKETYITVDFIICINRKYLRTKVKKGFNKGKTRVTVVTLF